MPDTNQELAYAVEFSKKDMEWHSEGKIQKNFKPEDLEFRSCFFLITYQIMWQFI